MNTVDIISIKNNIFRLKTIYSNEENKVFIDDDIFRAIIPLKIIDSELNYMQNVTYQ